MRICGVPPARLLGRYCSYLLQNLVNDGMPNSVCCFSMMKQVRLCAVWPTENWLGSSRNHIQGWRTVWECWRHAFERGGLDLYQLSIFDIFYNWKDKYIQDLDHSFSDLCNSSLRRGRPRLVADLGDGVEHAPVVVMVVMEVAVVVSEACIWIHTWLMIRAYRVTHLLKRNY